MIQRVRDGRGTGWVILLCVGLLGGAGDVGGSGLDTWTRLDSGTTAWLHAVDYVPPHPGGMYDGYYVATGEDGAIVTSPDGGAWTAHGVEGIDYGLYGVSTGLQHVVIVGTDVIIAGPAHDIGAWRVASQYEYWLKDVTYAPELNLFVAVGGMPGWGGDGTTQVTTSMDGFSWTQADADFGRALWGVAYGNGRFVAVGDGGFIASSENGADWTVRIESGSRDLMRVAYGGGRFVAGGWHGLMRSSADGITWSDEFFGPAGMDVWDLAYGNGTYCAVGQYAGIQSSPDGTTWTAHDSGLPEAEAGNLAGLTFAQDRFLAVGQAGLILQSAPVEDGFTLRVEVAPEDAGGTAPAAGETHRYPQDERVTVTATANPGYRFTGWSGSASGTYPSLTVTMTENKTLTAHFAIHGVVRRDGPDMHVKRMGHWIAVLPDGKVGVFGGHGTGFSLLPSFEIWDPETNAFALAAMPFACDGGAFVRLADGRHLLAGGAQAGLGAAPGLANAMIHDPVAGTVTATAGLMTRARVNCRGASLGDGRVLIVGGWYDPNSPVYGEVFDPGTETFSATNALGVARALPVVLPTTDGGAVVAGGWQPTVGGAPITTVEYYSAASNAFSVLSQHLFPDETGWILGTDLPRDIQTQRTAAGEYVLYASRNAGADSALAIFNPDTKSFRKLAIDPPLSVSGTQVFAPLVDVALNRALLVAAKHEPFAANSVSWPVLVDLATGRRTTAPDTSRVTDYWVGGSASALLADGSLFVTGGTEAVDWYTNFQPVEHTFFITVGYGMGPPSVIDHDRYGILRRASNVQMVRTATGVLHVAYTKRQRPAPAAGYFNYVRHSADDGLTWSNAVRTEAMPDSSTVYSLAVDVAGRLYQGFTFNVGSFFTSSGDGGATWTSAVALRDGGWGDWDYEPSVAVSADGVVHAAFHQYFGWSDPPSNVSYKTSEDGGATWWNAVALTRYPNDDTAGDGATAPRLCLGRDGVAFVAFTEMGVATRRRMLTVYDGNSWGTPFAVSDSARLGWGGDVAVDSIGRAHLVWLESAGETANAAVFYAMYDPATGTMSPARALTVAETTNVGGATVGIYVGDRVAVAYDVIRDAARADSTTGGIFVVTSADGFTVAARVSDREDARAPGLRSVRGMAFPEKVDITWVESAATGGENLMHRLLVLDELATATGTITVSSSVAGAPFALTGPAAYAGTTADGLGWSEEAAPVGTYTLTWGTVPGHRAPASASGELAADETLEFTGFYVPDGKVLLTLATDPADGSGGGVALDPVGTPVAAGAVMFDTGAEVELTALPADGYRFVEWLGAASGSDLTTTVALEQSAAVTAVFAVKADFSVTTFAAEHGAITPGAVVTYGGSITIEITPEDGYEVDALIVNGVSVGAVTSYTLSNIRRDMDVRAAFAQRRLLLYCDIQPPRAGTATADEDGYAPGETATLTATPATGYRFTGWAGDATGTEVTATVVMDDNHQVIAQFTPLVPNGDVDVNGVVDVRDAEKGYRMAIGLDAADLATADLDRDGMVTARDAGLILKTAAGQRQRSLISQVLATSDQNQTVSHGDEISVTVPGGLLQAPATLTVTEMVGMPPPPPMATAAGAAYGITLGDHSDFDADVTIEFGYDPALPGDRLTAWFWDEPLQVWRMAPATVDTVRHKIVVPTRHLSYWTSFLVPMVPVTSAHFLVFYDPQTTPTLPGSNRTIAEFARLVSDLCEAVYTTYRDDGYRVPPHNTARPGIIWLSNSQDVYREGEYSWKTGMIYYPIAYANYEELQGTVAHELFHTVQNQSFSVLGNFSINRWLMEATAEYASRRVAWDNLPFRLYMLERQEGLRTVDEVHEYAHACMFGYLADQGVAFKPMWDILAASFQVSTNFENHVSSTLGRPFHSTYLDFRHAALFDSRFSDFSPQPPILLHWPSQRAPVTGLVHETTLTTTGDIALDYFKAPLRTQDPADSIRVAVEPVTAIPENMLVNVFLLPEDAKVEGGIAPVATFSSAGGRAYAMVECNRRDAVYVTAFGRKAKDSVIMRTARVTLTMDPATIESAELDKLYTFSVFAAPVPNAVQRWQTTWDFGDLTKPLVAYHTEFPADAEFQSIHRFMRHKRENYTVTFTLRDADTGWLIGQATSTVKTEPKPSILFPVTVLIVPQYAPVEFELKGSDLPDAPLYSWNFGDGSPTEGPEPGTTRIHAYSEIGTWRVTGKLYAGADPDTVLAQDTCQVIVQPPPSGNAGFDYSRLRRVEQPYLAFLGDPETLTEVFYVDADGVRQGIYEKTYDWTGGICERGYYVNGKKEGRWIGEPRLASGEHDVRHYMDDLMDGPWMMVDDLGNVLGSEYRVLGMPSGHSTISATVVDYPELHPGDPDNPDEPVFYHTANIQLTGDSEDAWFLHDKRTGLYKRFYPEGFVEQEGTFTAGRKIGVWKYYDRDGNWLLFDHGDGMATP